MHTMFKTITLILVLLFAVSVSGRSQVVGKQYFKYSNTDSTVWIGLTTTADKMSADVFLHLKGDAETCTHFSFSTDKLSNKHIQLAAISDDKIILTGKLSEQRFEGIIKMENDLFIMFNAERLMVNSTLKMNELYRNASQKLIPKDVSSPEAIIEAKLLVPVETADTVLEQSLGLFYSLTDDDQQHLRLEQQLNVAITGFLSQYAQAASFEGEKGPSFQWFKTIDVTLPWADGLFTTFSKQTYVFTGGAHGMQHNSFVVIKNQDKVALSADDVFVPEAREEISKLLTSMLKKNIGIATGDSLSQKGYFVDEVPFTSNFYIHPVGICFYYNSYEIAPYAYGHTAIHLTYKQLAPFLKTDFYESIKAAGYLD